MYSFGVILISLTVHCSVYPDNGVIKLTKDNYFDIINKGNVFVR